MMKEQINHNTVMFYFVQKLFQEKSPELPNPSMAARGPIVQ